MSQLPPLNIGCDHFKCGTCGECHVVGCPMYKAMEVSKADQVHVPTYDFPQYHFQALFAAFEKYGLIYIPGEYDKVMFFRDHSNNWDGWFMRVTRISDGLDVYVLVVFGDLEDDEYPYVELVGEK